MNADIIHVAMASSIQKLFPEFYYDRLYVYILTVYAFIGDKTDIFFGVVYLEFGLVVGGGGTSTGMRATYRDI